MKKSEVFISLRPNKDVQTKRRPTREGKSYKSEANKKSFTFPYQYNKDNIEKKQFLFGEELIIICMTHYETNLFDMYSMNISSNVAYV